MATNKWFGIEENLFEFPFRIAIDTQNGFVCFSDNCGERGSGSDSTVRIQKFDLSGNFIRQWITTDNHGNGVLALAATSDGNVIALQGSHLLKFDFQ